MKIYFQILCIVILSLLYLNGCKKSVNDSDTNNDISVDKRYLKAFGGDPRGKYSPNSPFVFTFGLSDSLTAQYGEGILEIDGSSSTSGVYILRLKTRIGGRVSGISFPAREEIDTTNGTWIANGGDLTITIGGFSRTISFTADSKGLYVIYPYLSTYPPLKSLLTLLSEPGSDPDSTVWVFKRNP